MLAHLGAALDAVPDDRGDLQDAAALVRAVVPGATWTTYEGLEDVVAWTTTAGPGAPLHLDADRGVAAGVLLQAPTSRYPDHVHAARERYLVLAGDATGTCAGRGDRLVPGAQALHEPEEHHRSTTGDLPLLVVFVWTGDVTGPTRLAGRDADPPAA